jgi:AraC-like DNA-binding protein
MTVSLDVCPPSISPQASEARHNDKLRVSEIAYTCGFNEVSYFNRRFRARFGASPTEYRGAANS